MKKAKRFLWVLLLALVLTAFPFVAASCGAKGKISFEQTKIELNLGQRVKLDPTVEKLNKEDIVWSTSDAAVVTVYNGVVQGVGEGSAIVTAAIGEISATVEFNVTERVIDLGMASKTIELYDTLSLEPTLTNITEAIVWTSSDPSVATVDGGKVTLIKEGETTITAKANGAESSLALTVVCTQVPSVSVIGDSVEVIKGKMLNLNAKINFLGIERDGNLAFESGNEAIATVSAEGEILGVSAGETTVTIKGSYNGYVFADKVINVTVKDDVELRLSQSAVTLYASNPDGESYLTQADITAECFEDGNKIDSATVVWTSGNDNVVKVNNGVITVDTYSDEPVTVTASYTSTKGKQVTATVSVTALAPVIDLGAKEIVLSDGTESVLAIASGWNDSEFECVKAGDDEVSATAAASGVTLSHESLKKLFGEKTITVKCKRVFYSYDATIITHAISTAADLQAMRSYQTSVGSNNKNVLDGYFVLRNNVDASSLTNFKLLDEWSNQGHLGFIGTLDGRGYSIGNIGLANAGLFGYVGAKGTIKNLGIVTASGGDYAIASEFRGKADNVFVYAPARKYCLQLSDDATLSNSIVVLSDTDSAIVNTAFDPRVSIFDVYGIADNMIKSNSVEAKYIGRTAGDYSGFDTALFEGLHLASSAFDGAYWEERNGLPAFKSYAEATLEFTDPSDRITYGSEYSAAANVLSTFSIKETKTGITVSADGRIQITDEAVDRTQFTVVAKSLYGQTKEKTYTYLKLTTEDHTADGYAFDYDKSTGAGITVSLDGINNVWGIGVGNLIMEDGFTFSGGNLTVPHETLLATVNGKYGDIDVKIYTSVPSVGSVCHIYKASVVSKIIDSAEDLAAITAANTAATIDEYYIVSKDIDASSAGIVRFVNNNTQGNNEVGFKGIFDGRGHVISNITTEATAYNGLGGLFGLLLKGSVVKNIAFTDVTMTSSYKYVISGESKPLYGTMENVVITAAEGVTLERVVAKMSGGEMKNCLFVGFIQINTDTGVTTVSNVMSVTTENATGGFSWTGNATYDAQPNYATINAMFAALAEDNKLQGWGDISYANGAIYFNGKVAVLPALVANSNAIGSEIERGTNVTFTTDDYTELSLKNEIAGITLSNNVLSIGNTVAENTVIIVVATSTLNTSVRKDVFEYKVIRGYTEVAIGAYDLSLVNETSSVTTSETIEGDIEKVRAGSIVVTEGISFAGGNLTFTKAALQSLLNGKAYVMGLGIEIFTSADKKYTATVDIATMIIDSAEDLAAITAANTAATIDEYYIVSKDIDASSAGIVRFVNNNTQGNNEVGFKGIFDGRGHVISNITTEATAYNGLGGLFGLLLKGSVVKNIAFTDVTMTSSYKYVISGESKPLYGTMENVVITAAEGVTLERVVAKMSGGEMKNCLFVGFIQINTDTGVTTVSNVMSVTTENATGGFSWTGNATYDAQPNYATINAMFAALAENNAISSWNSDYIAYDSASNAITFNGMAVLTATE